MAGGGEQGTAVHGGDLEAKQTGVGECTAEIGEEATNYSAELQETMNLIRVLFGGS